MCYMNSLHCIYLMLLAIGLNKLFLIPDSCWSQNRILHASNRKTTSPYLDQICQTGVPCLTDNLNEDTTDNSFHTGQRVQAIVYY